MKRLPNEIWYEILNHIDDFTNIKPVSRLFDNYFTEKAKQINTVNIEYKYRYGMYKYTLDNKYKIYANKLSFMKYFPNTKKLYISNNKLTENINKIISKCFPAGITKLSLYIEKRYIEDDTGRHGYSPKVKWQKLKRFKNLTHLYISCDIFYDFHDSDPEDDFHSPRFSYVDGSPSQSVHKIINTLQDTKLYYIYVANYDHDWSGYSNVFVIKNKTPEFEKELKQLEEDCQNREYTYDII